jgi:beta-glucosidase
MKYLAFLTLLPLALIACNKLPVYKNSHVSEEKRVEDLLSKMTLQEKIEQLVGNGVYTKDNSRLGIPGFKMCDGAIGVRYEKTTAWPSGDGMAASWDTIMMNKIGIAVANETRGKAQNVVLGPCINIHRMPFGGRNFESYSEDPYLTARLAVSYIKGIQSKNVIPSAKHFACNNAEWERMKISAIVDDRALNEIYLPAFKAVVKEAHVWCIMSSYNKINGVYASENEKLQNQILKKEWGYDGFVVSDWDATHSTVGAALGGLDIEMPQPVFFGKLLDSVNAGKVSKEIIDDKVRRILRIKFRAGLFETPLKRDSTLVNTKENQELALEAARKGIVLLKNENNILPLDRKKIKSIAIIGPNAAVARTGAGGSSHVDPVYSISPLEGIKKKVAGAINLYYAEGDKYLPPKHADAIDTKYFFTDENRSEQGLKGEYFDNIDFKGKPVVVRMDKNIDFNFRDEAPVVGQPKDNFAIRWTGVLVSPSPKKYKLYLSHDDGLRFWLDGKLLINKWVHPCSDNDTIDVFLDQNKPHAIKIEYYDLQMGASVKFAWDHDMKQEKIDNSPMIAEAVAIAKKSDVAVVFAGLSQQYESEGTDVDLNLPGSQNELIKQVVAANPNTIVVLNGGCPMLVNEWIDKVPGFIDALYLGQETGTALADVLFGDFNPSGKLPFTYIMDLKDNYALKGYRDKSLIQPYSEGIYVGYRYYDQYKVAVRYPFGFGLSYTQYDYSNLKIKKTGNEAFEVSVDVTNSGKIDGSEIVQLYVSENHCPVDRPVKELKAFSKVFLKAGGTKTLTMKLNENAFAYYHPITKKWTVDSGIFRILIGKSSRDIVLAEEILIK